MASALSKIGIAMPWRLGTEDPPSAKSTLHWLMRPESWNVKQQDLNPVLRLEVGAIRAGTMRFGHRRHKAIAAQAARINASQPTKTSIIIESTRAR